MPKPIRYLAVGLVSLAGLGFLGGIFMAGYYTLWIDGAPQPTRMPAFVSQFVTAAGAVLGTNLGAALGIRATLRRWRLTAPPDPSEGLRIGAALFYAACLVVALVFWGLAGFTDDPDAVVGTLPELSRIFAGVVVGTLAVTLGIPRDALDGSAAP